MSTTLKQPEVAPQGCLPREITQVVVMVADGKIPAVGFDDSPLLYTALPAGRLSINQSSTSRSIDSLCPAPGLLPTDKALIFDVTKSTMMKWIHELGWPLLFFLQILAWLS